MAFILSTSQKQDVSFKSRAFPIRWPYEVLSQAARIAALVSVNMAFLRGSTNLLNVLALVYAFAIGLLRLVSRPRRRRMILGQVNYVLTAILLLLLVAQTLPCIQTGVTCGCDSSIAAAIASLAAAFLIAITTPTEWIPPNTNIDIPGWAAEHEAPALEETCSWIDYYCTYNWLDPILWKGIRNKLDMSGIPRLAWYDEPMYLLRQLQRARSIHQKTLFTVIRYQWKELTIMAIMSMAAFAVENISPYAMYRLLDHISDPAAAVYQPWVWLALMFFGPLVRSVLYQQYVFTSTRLVVRIRAGMTQELYHRALESMELDESHFHAEDSPGLTHKSTAAGRLANLMASDIQSIFRARDVIQVFIGVPVGTAISLFGMYRMLGWPSLVGTAVLLIGAPITIWLGQLQFRAQKKVRQAQDSRISLVTEYLASIRAIKYFAWEDAITAKIVDSRSVEQNQLWQVSLMSALMSQITQVFPYLSLLVMFGLHVALRGSLDASMAFTTVVLVKNIRRNLVQASTVGRSIAAAVVSLRRLDDYFGNTVPLTRYPKGPLRIQGASFRRSKKAVFTLEDVSLEFAQGGLNVISGPSGSGKTTLLLSILGETYLEKGSVTRPDDVAYASQSAWLQNDTIRANILFGSAMEKARYDRVVKACCLLVDFKELPNGDNTIVGENGTSLSGGQKARVALARALYSKAPLLLLDDIFSALDAKTSAGVWKYCFCGDLLRGRTTVLVTQVPWITDQADLSIILDRGRVQEVDPHIGVVRQPIEIAQVLGGGGDDDDEGDAVAEPTLQANGDPLNDEAKVANHDKPKDIVSQEAKASGKLGRFASLQYMAYFGHPAIGFGCILFMVTTNVFFFGNGLWLSEWVEAYSHEGYVDVAYYMGIYSLICVIEILTWGCSIILFEWGAWRAAKKLHNDFIHAIMSVSLSWFKVIPIGRITNRFSGDMTSIDSMLGSMLRACVDAILSLLFRLAAVSTIMPIFMVPAFFTCLFGVVIGEIYTRAAVIAKRMTSSAQSPIFSQYGDTLAGLSIIRARAGIPQEFMLELASKLRVWAAVQQTSFNLNRWVAIRVDLVTALVALCAGIIALSQTGYISAALVGFSLSNSNSLNKSILYLVRAMNDWEVEIQSFHRVKEYVKLEPEEKNDEPFPEQGEDNEYVDDESQVIPSDWPRSGDIEFRNVTIRYDMDGPDILTDVNLKFKAGERVAVVGRTGSGKSTLVLSLLRFTHVVSGQILYDGIDITKIPRGRLRESLTIIPQEAVLFNGSVQTNLDPTGLVSEEKLLRALDNCRGIASFSDDTPDFAETISLASEVDARGENFSHGQRQVLSLCRALIRQSKLMLLDEATASMDYETDRGIQQVLRDELAVAGGGRTLVTIAHRLRTIIDYDSVIVMSAGRVVECGSPQDLYHAKGQFYDMVQHSGEVEVLQQVLDSSSEEGRQ
ncbi:P-loop containing nucleoside triphosphate hydrolase protein [Stachybotrys elegans]|uniref:P-loop containing nucleoside triphosphate hydrolase protein n=1 Tax=Stachybotrys elegans TaxID=80388 RepID=A0A8K0WWD2_9HYPO|nr:P-loop containing nucleoside triphosphate hydrolase protein [Stachybotrys elegans]